MESTALCVAAICSSSHCRICKGHVDHNGAHYPFCSEKCKQVDLGRWATGQYAVSRPATEEDMQAADAARRPG